MKNKERKALRFQYFSQTLNQWAPPTYTEWLEDKVLEKDKKPPKGKFKPPSLLEWRSIRARVLNKGDITKPYSDFPRTKL